MAIEIYHKVQLFSDEYLMISNKFLRHILNIRGVNEHIYMNYVCSFVCSLRGSLNLLFIIEY